jgi:hypothetical protein
VFQYVGRFRKPLTNLMGSQARPIQLFRREMRQSFAIDREVFFGENYWLATVD